ncbi:DUF2383 domain-containing protein [Ovoidimarina sediminis]|uniref:DUF2383 domain-containing protein n=1 Tax=Ovoidimarina sediminis TaxID=3079856 RepID=UPI0029104F22|nr:DUF2383 domain-containing protein [Rhodophyticola sp. MJ-SS7]MDU8944629.1 DUF2383 domain-containing protein [Rhodophyticola sp. MJ-SS7]
MDTHKVNTSEQPISAISQLATDVVDAIRGYETMIDLADEDLRPVVERLHALHNTHAGPLLTMLDELGGSPDEVGSAFAMVHRAVAKTRNLFGALDSSAVRQIVDGEERLVNSYSNAISNSGSQPEYRNILSDQRDELRAEITTLRT